MCIIADFLDAELSEFYFVFYVTLTLRKVFGTRSLSVREVNESREGTLAEISLSLSLSLLSVSGASDKLKKLPSKKNRVTGFRSQESDAPYEIRMKGYKNIHKVLTEWTGWRFGQNR